MQLKILFSRFLIFKKFYLFIFLLIISKLKLIIRVCMKTKKPQVQNKRDVIDRFLSILWRKEVGDLRYTTK